MATKSIAAVTSDDRPAVCLAASPEVSSIADAELAFAEMSWVDGFTHTLEQAKENALNQLNASLESQKVITLDGDIVPLSTRREQLHAALIVYADANREELCMNNNKSVELQHGKLRWAKQRDSVGYQPDENHKTVCDRIGKRDSIRAKLLRIIARLNLADIVTVQLKISLTKARDAIANQRLTKRRVKDLGLQFVEGKEETFAEPAKFSRKSPG